ncbi:MAG: glycosyltransferase family 4 protein [Flavobacteriaceae bacterium]
MPKVLVITYYWPPAGGPGVQRWLSFTRYLPEFGFQPLVFIPDNPHYPIKDESLLSEVPADLAIYRQKIFEPYSLAKVWLGNKTDTISSGIIRQESQSWSERFMLWIRGNLFIPDARKFWIRPACKKILEIIKKEEIETLITTGPPHSLHLIGLEVSRKTGVKWIADFRDPWTSIGYHSKLKLGSAAQKKHIRLEKEVLNSADKIITTSRTTRDEFSRITSKPITVITNGFEDSMAKENLPLDQTFSLSFIGSLLSGRNPTNLWKAISELISENKQFREYINIKIVGLVSEDVLERIYHYGLKDHTTIIPYVSHKEAQEYQRSSQVLLLLEIDRAECKGIIPGKLFEYMSAKRPILAIGPADWEAGLIVETTKSGVYFGYESHQELKTQILEWYELFRQAKLHTESDSIAMYSRRSRTEKLAEELKWE